MPFSTQSWMLFLSRLHSFFFLLLVLVFVWQAAEVYDETFITLKKRKKKAGSLEILEQLQPKHTYIKAHHSFGPSNSSPQAHKLCPVRFAKTNPGRSSRHRQRRSGRREGNFELEWGQFRNSTCENPRRARPGPSRRAEAAAV